MREQCYSLYPGDTRIGNACVFNNQSINISILFYSIYLQVWNTTTCEFVRTLNGHKRGIACLQYRDRLVVSGSSDNTIRFFTSSYFLLLPPTSSYLLLLPPASSYFLLLPPTPSYFLLLPS